MHFKHFVIITDITVNAFKTFFKSIILSNLKLTEIQCLRQNVFVINNFWIKWSETQSFKDRNNKISLVAIMVCATQWKSLKIKYSIKWCIFDQI